MLGDISISDPAVWAVLAVLITVSALASTAEAALFSLSQVSLVQMEEKGLSAVKVIKELLSVPGRLIVTLTLAGDAVNILAVVLITWIAVSCRPAPGAPAWQVWVQLHPQTSALAASLALILIAAQTLPKALGVRAAESLAPSFATPLTVLAALIKPLRSVVCAAAEALLKALGAQTDDQPGDALAEEEIRELVEAGSRQGLLDVTERELLVNLLRSGDIKASDIMTPRHEIEAVPAKASEPEVRALLKESDFSRLPVFEGERDHYVGVITAKDLLKLRTIGAEGGSVRDVMRPAIMVPESRRITDLLLDFKRGRLHLALVADEFGAVSGLVTMEDVLEEIFGEINETDDEPGLVALSDHHWKVIGGMELADFNAATGARLPTAGAATVAGLVLARIGRRPRPGDQVRVGGFNFQVLDVHGIIIHRLEVRKEADK